jgi:hypothetical protein
MAEIQIINNQMDNVSSVFETHAFNLYIRPEIEATLISDPQKIIYIFEKSDRSLAWLYTLSFNRGTALLESGKFHSNTGTLDSDGSNILKMVEISCDKLYYYGKLKKEDLPHVKENLKTLVKTPEKMKEGCYIATMVYGSYEANEVLILRNYRDNVLSKTRFGNTLINIYYSISPSLVSILKDSKSVNKLIKRSLDLIIKKL